MIHVIHKCSYFLLVAFLVQSGLAYGQTKLKLDIERFHDLKIEEIGQEGYSISTTGRDPYVFSKPLLSALNAGQHILSFEYFCPSGISEMKVYFGPDISEKRSLEVGQLGMSEGWVMHSFDLSHAIDDWGRNGDIIRIDFGSSPGINLQLRRLTLRHMTAREKEIAATREAKKRQETVKEENLMKYLSMEYESKVSHVAVGEKLINVKGNVPQEGLFFLCEVSPSMDVTEAKKFETRVKVEGSFEMSIERFVERNNTIYDRLLSKWVIATEDDELMEVKSHARYADDIISKYNLPVEKPTSKKGLGGFSFGRGHVEDLDELDITSATINIWFTRFMYTNPADDRIKHTYNRKDWYFGKEDVEKMDNTFKSTAEKNIITAAILLVSKADQCPDPEIGRLMQHPDMDPAGIYSMPNMTTPESVECYAAALDFLASRYSRDDKKNGRIHHWIMHNEVDAGWVWTNMGRKTELIFMDEYFKSMRMCYNIARSYNPHSEVFISLTHYWAWTSRPEFYPSKNLMEILLDYTHAEGDFKWAMAHHPYPESLFEPKTWLDQKVNFTYNTPLITFKNIEVLNSWIKRPEVLYKGKTKRTLWLSENGTNSKTYTDKDLKEQAAGFAYTWKKLKRLDGIDGFQWHNWFDHRKEGGLRIGLRKFPDDEIDPGGKKPVWYVYQAADRANEDEVFDQYKELIGIDHWDQLNYFGEIEDELQSQSYRDIKADTWVATDALGRKSLTFDSCGGTKEDRYVGMFYFMTHLDPGQPGPYDVSKIKAANPENPHWGKGSHYWGEPEIGYYLNNEEWALRRHAFQLADAGVDVIVFDVTNDRTYPEVYLAVCKVWREMRLKGEKTPDIAFLGSEVSVNKLWEDFYEKGMYPELWFMWKGKPLLLYGWHEQSQRNKMNEVKFSEDIQNFFSLRQSWAWTSLPWYEDGKDEWPWLDHYPQTIGWHEDKQKAEHVPVAVAQHPLSNIGRSFHDFHQPETNILDLTPLTDQGLHFQEQWNRALEVDPEFVFVTGWNEWSAGQMIMKESVKDNLLQWNFYPGAHLGKAGKSIAVGDTYFIDQYNQEYSRDIEPMKGGHSDNYYFQLTNNIRKYKGVSKPMLSGQELTIDMDDGFEQWKSVQSVYLDHIDDIRHRNSPGNKMAGPYVNNTGRNDIEESRITKDKEYIYFYAKTRDTLTSHEGSNWMLLFIDSDQDKSTGWEGYDYLINHEIRDKETTTIKNFSKGKWKLIGELRMKYGANELMVGIPRALIGEHTVSLDFHWADHIQSLDDINEFFLNGDSAPERRFNYRYESLK